MRVGEETRVKMRCQCGLRRLALLAAAVVCIFGSSPSFAQSPGSVPIAERLSADTVFYVQWRGMAYLRDAEKKNHVLQLVQDPAMAPVWLTVANNFQRNEQKQGNRPPVTLPELISLLDNPFAFGVTANGSVARASMTGATNQYGNFLVYDDTGKTALIEKLKTVARDADGAKVEVTRYDFSGTTIEVRTAKKDISYSAQAGPYLVMSTQKSIIEDLITRFRNAGASSTCVTRLPEYGEVKKLVGSDSALEFFARVPDVHAWAASDPKNQTPAKFFSDIHVEKVHVAGAGLTFDGEATRFRGAVLGDTSAGGPFDMIGSSSAMFQTQPVLSDGPAFSVWRINVPAIYRLVRNAIITNAPPQQAAGFLMIESMSERFLGMPLQSALALLKGEFASVNSYAEDGTRQQLVAVPIQKPDDVLRVLRAAASSMIVAEDSSGDATFLDVAYPYKDPKTGTQRRKFFYLAVTPEMLLGAPRKAMLRQAMQQLGARPSSAPASGIFANVAYMQMRALLPEKLSSLSASDVAAIPWDKVIADLQDQENQAAQQSESAQPRDLSQLKLAAPAIPRHLHMAVSGSWKDANGVYFDSYLQ
jgi:hypothetical protein